MYILYKPCTALSYVFHFCSGFFHRIGTKQESLIWLCHYYMSPISNVAKLRLHSNENHILLLCIYLITLCGLLYKEQRFYLGHYTEAVKTDRIKTSPTGILF